MKTFPIHSPLLKILFLLPIMLFWVFTAHAQEQNNTGKKEKRTISIHITKEVDGKTTQIDTTFEANDDFDVDDWVKDHDADAGNHRKMKKMERDIEMGMPDFDQEDMPSIPDTVIVNGDTVIVNTKIEKMFRDNPEFGDLGIERHFDMPDESFDAPPCPRMEEMPGYCPFMGRKPMQGMFPPEGLNIPGIENLIPFGDLDHLVIKKKRHGRKVILSFRENENEERPRHHNRNQMYYFNERDVQQSPGMQKRVIITDGKDKSIKKDGNTKVERYKDGDKEVIIIKKNKESEK